MKTEKLYTVEYSDIKTVVKKEHVLSAQPKTDIVPLNKAVALKIRSMRKARQLTQKQIAEKIGVVQNCFSRIEKGTYLPSVKKLEKLCEVFNCKSSDILPF